MILILYGSQTGTAIHLAKMLADMEFVIFICATHGDGQCPFNMIRFWTAITSDIPAIFRFKYAVLGLGDTNYQKYNWCAKMLYNRLKRLGAIPLLKTFANAQDQGGVYDGYYKFEKEILTLSCVRAMMEADRNDIRGQERSGSGPSHERTITRDEVKHIENGLKTSIRMYKATVISREVLTKNTSAKQVIEIIFDIPDYCGFFPGDCIGVYPENSPSLLNSFDYSDDEKRYLLKNVDLNSTPHQPTFTQLAELTDDQGKKDKLLEIGSDYDLYHSYAVRARRTIFEILTEFNIRPPYEFMASLSEIYPRYYSFARLDSGYYSVLVSIVSYKTYMATPRVGLCSEYLKQLNGSINVEIVPSRLYMEDQNLLFFATGSGITLPRSVIHYLKNKNVRVYYGFRRYEDDFLCKNEFEGFPLYAAASRDDGKRVMDVYREYAVENIDDWSVFVSGSAGLNRNISKLLYEVHGKHVPFQSETW